MMCDTGKERYFVDIQPRREGLRYSNFGVLEHDFQIRSSRTFYQLRACSLYLKSLTNNDPLSDCKCEAHCVGIFLSKCFVDKPLNLLP